MAFASLPSELVEQILVLCAALNDPRSIASLAATSRRYRATVYAPENQHLWRSIYLTTFDDPCPALAARGRHRPEGGVSAAAWGVVYRARVGAATLHAAIHTLKDLDPPDILCRQVAMYAINGVLRTALPMRTPLLSDPNGDNAPPLPSIRTPFENPAALGGLFIPAMGAFPLFPPVPVDPSLPSRDITWLRNLLKLGPFTYAYGSTRFPGGPAGALLAATGAQKISRPGNTAADLSALAEGAPIENRESVSEHEMLRNASRARVYDMVYLQQRNAWGPFQRVWRPMTVRATPTASQDAAQYSDDPANLKGAREAPETNIPPPRSSDSVDASPPPSSALEPDWSYLSAARVLLEANMREAVTRMRWADGVGYDGAENGTSAARRAALLAGIDRLCALDALRAYSAPRTKRPPDLGHTVEVPQRVHIDDWAGVNGIWRRAITWVDGDELLRNHARPPAHRYTDPNLPEAVFVMPMALRVVGPAGPASVAWPTRPPLAFVGAAGGPRATTPLRRVRGIVSVLGDGGIRWSMVITDEQDYEKWASEGVQLGGVQSQAGVLGLWTCHEHERMDPLGAVWFWKVT